MELELEKLVTGMTDPVSTDKWEDRYHQLFDRFSDLRSSFDAEVRTRQEIQNKLEKETKQKNVLREKEKELEESISDISEQCLEQRKEMTKLNEKLRCMAKTHLKEKDRQREDMEIMSCQLDIRKAKVMKMQNTIENLRRDIARWKEKCERQEIEKNTLQEKNDDLQSIIDDYKVGAALKDVKISDNFDIIFSKYLESFHGDETEVRHIFQDCVTRGSNAAFRMLVSLCFEDLVQNISSIVNVIGNMDRLVDLTVTLDLHMQLDRYMRVLQFKYVHLFFGGGEEAFKKASEMTRARMKYEEIELGNARQGFIVALLSKMENQCEANDTRKRPSALSQERQSCKKGKCLPAGF